ncbi:EbsA family protein [Carnobacterium gallinarum]|uniref:EbsA family protein n=1 Tax=Carnobacterium gallinarum TaxID=2749 RepID=UPI0012FC5160|nr:EbsA family protein [Carnobacterium gallinarum]
MNYSNKKSYRLSLEPAYQVIYWSVCSTMFFISFIGILELQRANVISIVFALLFIIGFYVGMGSSVTIRQNRIYLNYLRGVKKSDISIEEIEKIKIYYWGQDFSLRENSKSFELYFFNKRNKAHFWQEFTQKYQEIPITKEENTVAYLENSLQAEK